jgi:hypothetical protein
MKFENYVILFRQVSEVDNEISHGIESGDIDIVGPCHSAPKIQNLIN